MTISLTDRGRRSAGHVPAQSDGRPGRSPDDGPAESTVAGLRPHLDRWLADRGGSLIDVRRHLHAHPELSRREHRTAAYLAERLAAAGLRPRLVADGTGVVCEVGSGSRTVALRADLDALPLVDAKDVPYRSTVDGVCHACGHDVHAAVVLGAGLALASLDPDLLPGRVRLIFQPSEESLPPGSLTMIELGALDDVDTIYGLHCDPKIAAGSVGLRSGPLTAAYDAVTVHLTGPGGHTARPHNTVDIVNALGRVVTDVPALLGRRVDPRAGLSMVFGAVHAGVAPNAIPREGTATGTVRVLDRESWAAAPALVTELVHQVVAPSGAQASIDYVRGVPPVMNDPRATAMLRAGATAALGLDAVVDTPQSMGGEDFAWYTETIAGAMARLGVGRPGESLDLHQPNFDVDERAIAVGVRLLVHTALAALS